MPKKSFGQAAVAVLVLLTISLILGIGLSTNLIKSLRTSKEVDFASRAIAIAEAGIERLLAEDFSVLEGYINNNNCASACILEITGDDGITARTDIVLSFLGSSAEPFPIDLTTATTSEVSLAGYSGSAPVYICWDNTVNIPSIVALFIYGQPGSYATDAYAYNSAGSMYSTNGFDEAVAAHGFDNCFTISARSNPGVLRLKSVYGDVTAYVVPASGQSIPSQGILLESYGKAGTVQKLVKVLRTKSAVPAMFDYLIYQTSETEPLTNYLAN